MMNYRENLCIINSKEMSALLIGDSMVKYMQEYLPVLDVHFTPGVQVRELMPLITKDIFSDTPELLFCMQAQII